MQYVINQPLRLPFLSIGLTTGLTTFTTVFLVNGVVGTVASLSYTEIGGGLYTINFTPTTTGSLYIFIQNSLLHGIEIVAQSTTSILQNLQDESLGSWTWDKTRGVLTLIRQDTTTLATFNVVDTTTNASRERVS